MIEFSLKEKQMAIETSNKELLDEEHENRIYHQLRNKLLSSDWYQFRWKNLLYTMF